MKAKLSISLGLGIVAGLFIRKAICSWPGYKLTPKYNPEAMEGLSRALPFTRITY